MECDFHLKSALAGDSPCAPTLLAVTREFLQPSQEHFPPSGSNTAATKSYTSFFCLWPLHTMPCLHLTLNKPAEIITFPYHYQESLWQEDLCADWWHSCSDWRQHPTWGSAGQRDSSIPQKHAIIFSATSFSCHSHTFAKLLPVNHAKAHCWPWDAFQSPYSLLKYQLLAARC